MTSLPIDSRPLAGAAWRPLAAVLRFTLLDALRSRFPLMLAAVLAAAWGAAMFGAQLAITERQAVAVSLVAPLVRTLAAVMMATLVAAAVTREVTERTHLIALAAPVSRLQWVAAKFCAQAVLAWSTALVCGASMLAIGGAPGVAAWTFSLGVELTLVAALAVTAALALGQIATAVLATLAVYLASRTIGVMLLLNARMPLADSDAASTVSGWVLETLGLLLPRLDLFTRTDWLAGGRIDGLGTVALQGAIYLGLLLAVAAFDLARDDA